MASAGVNLKSRDRMVPHRAGLILFLFFGLLQLAVSSFGAAAASARAEPMTAQECADIRSKLVQGGVNESLISHALAGACRNQVAHRPHPPTAATLVGARNAPFAPPGPQTTSAPSPPPDGFNLFHTGVRSIFIAKDSLNVLGSYGLLSDDRGITLAAPLGASLSGSIDDLKKTKSLARLIHGAVHDGLASVA